MSRANRKRKQQDGSSVIHIELHKKTKALFDQTLAAYKEHRKSDYDIGANEVIIIRAQMNAFLTEWAAITEGGKGEVLFGTPEQSGGYIEAVANNVGILVSSFNREVEMARTENIRAALPHLRAMKELMAKLELPDIEVEA